MRRSIRKSPWPSCDAAWPIRSGSGSRARCPKTWSIRRFCRATPGAAGVDCSEPRAARRTVSAGRWGLAVGSTPATLHVVAAVARTTGKTDIRGCCTLTTMRLRPIYRWEYPRLFRLDFALKRAEDRLIFAADVCVRTRLGASEPAPGPCCANGLRRRIRVEHGRQEVLAE